MHAQADKPPLLVAGIWLEAQRAHLLVPHRCMQPGSRAGPGHPGLSQGHAGWGPPQPAGVHCRHLSLPQPPGRRPEDGHADLQGPQKVPFLLAFSQGDTSQPGSLNLLWRYKLRLSSFPPGATEMPAALGKGPC